MEAETVLEEDGYNVVPDDEPVNRNFINKNIFFYHIFTYYS